MIEYIAAFDLAAVCRYPGGRIEHNAAARRGWLSFTARNPAGAAAASWCVAAKAGPVIRAVRRHSGDILAAARALGVTVLARARHVVRKIEADMAWAQRTGVLHEFNQESRRRRLEAQRRGERFMG